MRDKHLRQRRSGVCTKRLKETLILMITRANAQCCAVLEILVYNTYTAVSAFRAQCASSRSPIISISLEIEPSVLHGFCNMLAIDTLRAFPICNGARDF